MISIPTGTKLMNWIYTTMGGILELWITVGYILLVSVLGMFTLGGTTGIVLGNAAMDVALHDTYYTIAHFHSILSLGAMVSTIVGVLYSQEILVAGSHLHGSIIYIYYYIQIYIGIILTFHPLHLSGNSYYTRRYVSSIDSYNSWNFLSSIRTTTTITTTTVTTGSSYPTRYLLYIYVFYLFYLN